MAWRMLTIDRAFSSWRTVAKIRWHCTTSRPTSTTTALAGPKQRWAHPSATIDPGQGPAILLSIRGVRRSAWSAIGCYILRRFEKGRKADPIPVGETAKSIFERAQLPNDVLGGIWNLADREQSGQLGLTEFIIAMHLLASFKNGSMRALPRILPPGLYEAATRRGVPKQMTGSRPTSDSVPASAIPRQFSGSGYSGQAPPRPQQPPFQPGTPTGDHWAITPGEKRSSTEYMLPLIHKTADI